MIKCERCDKYYTEESICYIRKLSWVSDFISHTYWISCVKCCSKIHNEYIFSMIIRNRKITKNKIDNIIKFVTKTQYDMISVLG